MHHQWFSSLPRAEQEQRKKFIESNEKVLDIAREIVYNMIMESRTSFKDYDSPSWAYKQADNNGYVRALEDVHKLLTIKEERH